MADCPGMMPDERGPERSAGNGCGAAFEDLAQDTVAAIEAARAAVRGMPVGRIGVSQGGWFARSLRPSAPDLAYVVRLSGAAITPAERVMFEEVNTLAEFGLPRPVARLLTPPTAWRIRIFAPPDLLSRIADDVVPHPVFWTRGCAVQLG